MAVETIDIRPGVSVLAMLRHLNYKPWYALGEFVDNSVQSFISHRAALEQTDGRNIKLRVDIDVNNGFPTYTLQGTYWTGSASANDNWTELSSLGTGANPASTLSITHSGSSGSAKVSIGGGSTPTTLGVYGDITAINPVFAISGTNENSQSLLAQGRYYNGSSSQVDTWSIQGVIGTGTTPTSTLTFTHTGSSGAATFDIGANGSVSNAVVKNGYLCVGNGSCAGATTAGTIYATSTSVAQGDFAEQYLSTNTTMLPGTLVTADTNNSGEMVAESGISYDPELTGVISTAPGVVIGDDTTENPPSGTQAYAGREAGHRFTWRSTGNFRSARGQCRWRSSPPVRCGDDCGRSSRARFWNWNSRCQREGSFSHVGHASTRRDGARHRRP